MYEGGLQGFYYIFSFSPFLLTLWHSPGNSGRSLVSCLCATTKCCANLSCCILCTPLFMLDPPLPRESHGPSLGPTLPVCQDRASPRTGPLHLQHACQRPCSHASEHRRNHTHSQNKLPSSAWFMYVF